MVGERRVKHSAAGETDSWRVRFCWAFAVGSVPMFAWCYFPGDGRPLLESLIAATVVGLLFGLLAALFGKRMFDFLMSFPW